MAIEYRLDAKYSEYTTESSLPLGWAIVVTEDEIDEVDEMVGAASYLGEAKDVNLNLFI